METLTINDLYKLCKNQIKKGNGEKKILISDDDEGNGFHELFFGISGTRVENGESFFDEVCIPYPYGVNESNIDDYVILG